jgi:crotonobetainyl-CoA:carnitine CoA-transferase CaiB-like acyl-CoA transferase
MPYDMLKDIRVLEVSLLAPDSLGGFLSDLGAEVIKLEELPRGDYVRELTPQLNGEFPTSLIHTRWNRGKKSLALSLKTAEGRALFFRLVSKSQVVIEGLRAGALERMGISWTDLQAANPAIVMCSMSGLGRTGPYRELATHGLFFDAYAGLLPPARTEDGTVSIPKLTGAVVGMEMGGLYGALAVLAALHDVARTGRGRIVEVSEAEVSAHFQFARIDASVNAGRILPGASMQDAVRYQYYETSDDRVVIFQAMEDKFWQNFCRGTGRADLLERFPSRGPVDNAAGNTELRKELQRLFRTRTQTEWVDFFISANVAGGPVQTPQDLATDRHFVERNNFYDVDYPGLGTLRLTGTPIKVEGEVFSTTAAPLVGQDSEEVLRGVLGLKSAEIADLKVRGVVGVPDDDIHKAAALESSKG